MSLNFLQLCDYFRDDDQCKQVRDIIRIRLADDRNQEECRYLMRFWWQLIMTYREVTLSELERSVSPKKLEIIRELLNALETGVDAVDTWIEKYTRELPVIEDRGFEYFQ